VARAIRNRFGSEPSIDIDAQRAIVVMTQPRPVDWAALDRAISRMSFTFGGAHVRARGRLVESRGAWAFEFAGGAPTIPLSEASGRREDIGREQTIVGRVENWRQSATLAIIDSR
jgi:hypothetical protein